MEQVHPLANRLESIKSQLAPYITPINKLKKQTGLATGNLLIDQFTTWKGLPMGSISLFHGPPGLGSAALWIGAAKTVTQKKRWAAWINSDSELYPLTLQQCGVDLSTLFIISSPANKEDLPWVLTELISNDLFDLIGCDIGDGFL